MDRIRVKLTPSKPKGRKILSQKTPLGRPIPVITGMGGVLRDIESQNSQKIDELSQGVLAQGQILNNEIVKQSVMASNAIDGVRRGNASVYNELGKHILADNPHGITKATVGLERVDNTSDLEKPISRATLEALSGKADKYEIDEIYKIIDESDKKNEKLIRNFENINTYGGVGGNEYQIDANKNAIGTLSNLTTTDKSSLVGAVNELDSDKADINILGSYDVIATGSTEERSLSDRFADFVNVKDFGAKGDGVTDDTDAIQAALDARTGYIVFDAGTYLCRTLTIKKNQILTGQGGNTILLLKAGTNAPIIQSYNFDSYYSSHTFDSNTPTNFGMECMIIDGNRSNQTTLSQLVKLCGHNMHLHDLTITEAYGVGLVTVGVTPTQWTDEQIGSMRNIENLRITECTQEHWIFEGPADIKCGQIHTNTCGDDANVTTSSWFSGEEIASLRINGQSFHADYLNLNSSYKGRCLYAKARLDIGTLITAGGWGGAYFEDCFGEINLLYAQNNVVSVGGVANPYVHVKTKNLVFDTIIINRSLIDLQDAVGVYDENGYNTYGYIMSRQAPEAGGTLIKCKGSWCRFDEIRAQGCGVALETTSDCSWIDFNLYAMSCGTVWVNNRSNIKGHWEINAYISAAGQTFETGVTTSPYADNSYLSSAKITVQDAVNNKIFKNSYKGRTDIDVTYVGDKTYTFTHDLWRTPRQEEMVVSLSLGGQTTTVPQDVFCYLKSWNATTVSVGVHIGTAGNVQFPRVTLNIN